MGMEYKLEQLISNLEKLSGINEQSEDTPIVMRHTDVSTNRTYAIVCAQGEPINMVLPMNVVWICFRPDSMLYRKALRRISKNDGIFQSENIKQDWEVLYFYEDVLEEQVYDPSDLTLVGVSPVPFATTEALGKVRLSIDPIDSDYPVAIVEGDERLSNPRTPNAHTHEEKPATMLAHATGHANIIDSVPEVGAALLFDAAGDLVWRKIKPDDLT